MTIYDLTEETLFDRIEQLEADVEALSEQVTRLLLNNSGT